MRYWSGHDARRSVRCRCDRRRRHRHRQLVRSPGRHDRAAGTAVRRRRRRMCRDHRWRSTPSRRSATRSSTGDVDTVAAARSASSPRSAPSGRGRAPTTSPRRLTRGSLRSRRSSPPSPTSTSSDTDCLRPQAVTAIDTEASDEASRREVAAWASVQLRLDVRRRSSSSIDGARAARLRGPRRRARPPRRPASTSTSPTSTAAPTSTCPVSGRSRAPTATGR